MRTVDNPKPTAPEVAPKADPNRYPIPVIDISHAIQARLGRPIQPGAN